MPTNDLIIVTGMTGAGRSTAAKALEDLGWFVIDNLPPQMLRPTMQLIGAEKGAPTRIAVVVDVRSRSFFSRSPQHARGAGGEPGARPRVLFLEASDDVLVRRQDAARRPIRCRPARGCSTGSPASASWYATCAATPTC